MEFKSITEDNKIKTTKDNKIINNKTIVMDRRMRF